LLVTAAKTANFTKRGAFAAVPAAKMLASSKRWSETITAVGTAKEFAVTADYDSAADFNQQERTIGLFNPIRL